MRTEETKIIQYVQQVFAAENAPMQRVRAQGEKLRPGMQISAAEGQLLAVLAKTVQAKRILEIGTFVGYSALSMARSLPTDGELITLEADAKHAQIARDFFAESGLPIRLHEGKALSLLPALLANEAPFDLIFIDADKLNYLHYYELTLPHLRPGGLMLADNSLLFGAIYGEAKQDVSPAALVAMQALNQRMATSGECDAILLPTAEGLTIGVKR